MKFPEFSIHDMVESEHRLATEVLHLSRLHAVIGMSMGGMQAFAWAVLYPDFMDLVIPMAGSPQSTSYDKLLWTTEIDAIELDPAWNHGNPIGRFTRGLALAAQIESMNATSPDYRVSHTNSKGFDAFVGGIKKNAKGGAGIACDQIRQRGYCLLQSTRGTRSFSREACVTCEIQDADFYSHAGSSGES
jgi:homoserine O-acetyltransferase